MTAYLDAENAYTDAVTKPGEALREKLYEEMVGRIKETDLSVPYRHRRLLLVLADREGAAVPDLLPEEGEPRRRPRRSSST